MCGFTFECAMTRFHGLSRAGAQQFWCTKDPGQQAFTYLAGVGGVIKGWDQGCLGMQASKRLMQGGHARSCKVMQGHARSCKVMQGHARNPHIPSGHPCRLARSHQPLDCLAPTLGGCVRTAVDEAGGLYCRERRIQALTAAQL